MYHVRIYSNPRDLSGNEELIHLKSFSIDLQHIIRLDGETRHSSAILTLT